jgi:hypothetical protein
MGLLGRLLTLPAAPLQGVWWVMDQVVKEAERQYYDEGAIRQALDELDASLQSGAVSQAEHDAAEQELLDRLFASRRRAMNQDAVYPAIYHDDTRGVQHE